MLKPRYIVSRLLSKIRSFILTIGMIDIQFLLTVSITPEIGQSLDHTKPAVGQELRFLTC